jgi:hypothetical protein
LEVGGIGGAEVALGGDVESDGLGDGWRKVGGEKAVGEFFVAGVDAMVGYVFALLMEEMADVVEECGGDERVGALSLDGEVSGLEAVLEDGDRFAEVGCAALALHGFEEGFGGVECDGRCVHVSAFDGEVAQAKLGFAAL